MNSSPRTVKSKLGSLKLSLFQGKIGTTKDLIDRTNIQTILKNQSPTSKQIGYKKAPSSPKTQKTVKQLTIKTNLETKAKQLQQKQIKLISRTKTPVGNGSHTVLTKQPLSCKNKLTQNDPFFISSRAKKAETPAIKIQKNSPQVFIAKQAQNFMTCKNKENSEKENSGRFDFFKSALADKQIKAKRTMEAVESINTELLQMFNLDALIEQYTRILALYCCLNNQEECYIVIKQYTEAIQQDAILALDQLFKNNSTGSELSISIKYELLCILIMFYMLIEKGKADEFNEALEIIASSGYCLLNLIKSAFEYILMTQSIKKIDDFIKTSQTSTLFGKHKSFLVTIKKNNLSLKCLMEKLMKQIPNISCRGLLAKLPLLSLNEAVHVSFESFFSILDKKGVISVIDNEYNSTIKEENPDFIIQPFKYDYYLPRKTCKHEYTLVLDLDETLVHYDEAGGQFFLRPFAQEFINKTSKVFEVVIFTAAVKEYADWILDRLDADGSINHRLYRCSTSQQNGVYIKDLQKLGRDLSKMLIVDNSPENFQLQPENGIYIKSWYDDPNDKALEELTKVLQYVAEQKNKDIRETLKDIRVKSGKK